MSNEFDLTLYRRRGQVVVWGTNYYNCLKISSCIVVDVVQSLSLSSSLQPHGLQLGRLLSQCLLKLKSTESVMLSNHLILCCLFLLLSSIFPNNRVFFKESALCIGWSKYWSFSFSISPSNEYSEPISFPERTQTHVHWVGDAIQPSNPLSSPSPSFNLSQHRFFFFFSQWVISSYQVAKVLGFQLQHQSFQWVLRTDFLQDGLVGSPCWPKDSQESSPKPQFKSINSLVLGFLYSPTLTSIHDYWKNHSFY